MGNVTYDSSKDRIEVERGIERREQTGAKGKLFPVKDEPIDKHLDRLSFLLDKAIRIPGTDIRFGLDPIISFLFPVGGDVLGAIMSAYIVMVSIRHGLSKGVITRMVFNVGIDFLIGSIPLIGDLFDFAWKSNDKNMKLLNRYATGEKRSFWSDWAWLFVLMGILLSLMVGTLALVYYGLKAAGFRLV